MLIPVLLARPSSSKFLLPSAKVSGVSMCMLPISETNQWPLSASMCECKCVQWVANTPKEREIIFIGDLAYSWC